MAGRYLLNAPIKGAFEISEFLLAGVVFPAPAYVQAQRGHVRGEVLAGQVLKELPGKASVAWTRSATCSHSGCSP